MADLKILLAETSFLVRKGVIDLISEIPGFSIIKEIDDKASLHDEIELTEPDFILLNPKLFEANGCKTPLNCIPAGYRKKIIGLLNKEDNSNAFQFIETIYIEDPKSAIIQKLQNCSTIKPAIRKCKKVSEISEREKLVVKYIALGLTNKEIADKLFISVHTVTTHRKNIVTKLGIKTSPGLTIYAIMNNLIELDEVK